MATIADVAKLAGLSRATVSRVINNHPYVSDEKKQLVQQAMKELGYYPNSSAQRLRTQKTGTVAVLIPRLTNPFFTSLLEGLEMAATENGLQLLICQTKYNKEKELNFFNLLKSKQVDGLILTSFENEWDVITPFKECGPIILCNEYSSNATIPVVRLDQYKGSYEGTRHLIEKGHRKIAYCSGGTILGLAYDRKQGFRDALKEFGLEMNEQWVFPNADGIEGGKMVLKEILSMDNRPTAIFANSDQLAAGIIKEAKNHGVAIPDDLAILGFDDQPIAELMEPALTTIRQPTEDMAKKTMAVLISMLANEFPGYEEEVCDVALELIIREST